MKTLYRDEKMNIDDLQAYSDAWNAHDIEAIMAYMTEDCIFETGAGREVYGTRYEGYEAVKARFEEVWSELADVSFSDSQHFVQGDRGCSQWTFTATSADGVKLAFDGCDLFSFAEGKIRVKNSFIKNRTL